MINKNLVAPVFKSCLITGGNGYLGRHICQYFDAHGIDFYTLGSSKANTYVFDLANEIPVFKISFDVIIHCAGKAHTFPRTAQESQAFFDVNVTGTENLLRALEELPVLPRHFAFISSVSVYGVSEGQGIKENSPLKSSFPYGMSKIKAEELILNWCNQHEVTCLILRLPLLAGQHPPGNLKMMIQSIQKGYYFNISGGTIRKSVVMAQDVAEIIPKALSVGGTYNLTDGCHPSFKELGQLIAEQLGKPEPKSIPGWLSKLIAVLVEKLGFLFPINAYKFRKLTSHLTFDDSKARQLIGWRPNRVLEKFKIR